MSLIEIDVEEARQQVDKPIGGYRKSLDEWYERCWGLIWKWENVFTSGGKIC